MTLTFDRVFLRLTMIGAIAASLMVGGCGRKGPLDAPPSASVADRAAAAAEEDAETKAQAQAQSGDLLRKGSARGLPTVKGQKKTIPLDVLLD